MRRQQPPTSVTGASLELIVRKREPPIVDSAAGYWQRCPRPLAIRRPPIAPGVIKIRRFGSIASSQVFPLGKIVPPPPGTLADYPTPNTTTARGGMVIQADAGSPCNGPPEASTPP